MSDSNSETDPHAFLEAAFNPGGLPAESQVTEFEIFQLLAESLTPEQTEDVRRRIAASPPEVAERVETAQAISAELLASGIGDQVGGWLQQGLRNKEHEPDNDTMKEIENFLTAFDAMLVAYREEHGKDPEVFEAVPADEALTEAIARYDGDFLGGPVYMIVCDPDLDLLQFKLPDSAACIIVRSMRDKPAKLEVSAIETKPPIEFLDSQTVWQEQNATFFPSAGGLFSEGMYGGLFSS